MGLVRTVRIGPRLASHKVALYALADDGAARGEITLASDDIVEDAAMGDRQARRLRAGWERMGLLRLVHRGGAGPYDANRYEIHMPLLEALAAGTVSYDRLWRAACRAPAPSAQGELFSAGAGRLPCGEPAARHVPEAGSQQPPSHGEVSRGAHRLPCGEPAGAHVAEPGSQQPPSQGEEVSQTPLSPAPADPDKGVAKGDMKGDMKGVAKGDMKGDMSAVSSIKINKYYRIDDTDRALPEWAIAAVEQLEPERWPILAEAFLRWEGSAKAVDIGRAFVGWSKAQLGHGKRRRPGDPGLLDPATMARVCAMAGLRPDGSAAAGTPDLATVTQSRAAALQAAWHARRAGGKALPLLPAPRPSPRMPSPTSPGGTP